MLYEVITTGCWPARSNPAAGPVAAIARHITTPARQPAVRAPEGEVRPAGWRIACSPPGSFIFPSGVVWRGFPAQCAATTL